MLSGLHPVSVHPLISEDCACVAVVILTVVGTLAEFELKYTVLELTVVSVLLEPL